MLDNFYIYIDIWYREGEGEENVYKLMVEELGNRVVVDIDIFDNNCVVLLDYKEDEDLIKFYLEKIGWGFFDCEGEWKKNDYWFKMMCYKFY